jgi:hypothetical protein
MELAIQKVIKRKKRAKVSMPILPILMTLTMGRETHPVTIREKQKNKEKYTSMVHIRISGRTRLMEPEIPLDMVRNEPTENDSQFLF